MLHSFHIQILNFSITFYSFINTYPYFIAVIILLTNSNKHYLRHTVSSHCVITWAERTRDLLGCFHKDTNFRLTNRPKALYSNITTLQWGCWQMNYQVTETLQRAPESDLITLRTGPCEYRPMSSSAWKGLSQSQSLPLLHVEQQLGALPNTSLKLMPLGTRMGTRI